MKRMAMRMMSLLLMTAVLLCCVPAGAAVEKEIRFLDIPWGSDMKTACLLMQVAGVIGQEGVDRFEQTERVVEMRRTRGFGRSETSYPHFDREFLRNTVNSEDESANVEEVTLMSNMFGYWMGIKVHNVCMVFALDGETEKLVHVRVSLMVNNSDLRPELEEEWGKPDQKYDRTVVWQGANGTAMLYNQMEFDYGLLNAKEIVDASQMTVKPTPERTRRPAATPSPVPTPTPEPTFVPTLAPGAPGSDILDSLEKGEITFLGIPWDTDAETAIGKLTELGLFTEGVRENRSAHTCNAGFVLEQDGSVWKETIVKSGRFAKLAKWENYLIWNDKEKIGKSCGSVPVYGIRLTHQKDGEETRLKSVEILMDKIDGFAAKEAIAGRISEILGEGTDWNDTLFWKGDNGTMLLLSAREKDCTVEIGIDTPQ